MEQPRTAPPRICPNCDGFSAVAITLGGRDRAGTRRTITAHCPACHGTGKHFSRRAVIASAGR
ncbi:hypothetical protein ACIRUY_19545 [Streptomyces erythrochromogenes]|uniref:hypothetical protein n=1 Tax=Streptomyces erythrochromogenes TaxID=285574 RepID=UPI0037F8F38B